MIGLALLLYALVLSPFVAVLAGRPFRAAEVFGIAPDPNAIATLGVVSMASNGTAAWSLLVVPAAWCLVSGATLYTMGAWEGWIPLTAAVLALASRLWPRTGGRASRAA